MPMVLRIQITKFSIIANINWEPIHQIYIPLTKVTCYTALNLAIMLPLALKIIHAMIVTR